MSGAAGPVRELHDRITQAYLGELGEGFMKATQERLRWICAQVQGNHVLDIGCSQGIGPILLARAGHRVTGVDIDGKVISEARDYLAAEPQDVQDRVQFLHADAADLPVAAAYDTVVLGEILEHLENPGHLIEVAANHLAPGGRLVITVPFGIHDFPDHRQTFYCSEPYRLMSRHFSVTRAEIIDRWIGFVAIRAPLADTGDALSVSDLFAKAEAGFYGLERKLRNEITVTRKTAATRLRAAEAAREAAERAAAATRAEAVRVAAAAEEAAARAAEALEAARLRGEHLQTELERSRHETEIQRRQTALARRDYAGRIRRMARATEALARQLRDIETSESFRIGHAVVRMLKTPQALLRGRRSPPRRNADVLLAEALAAEAGPLPMSLSALIDLLDAEGPEGIVAALRARLGVDAPAFAAALMRSARALTELGRTEAELPLAVAAAQAEHSDSTVRGLYWAARRAGELSTVRRCLAEIAQIYGPDPTPTQRQYLEKMRAGPLGQLALLDAIPAPAPRSFEPVRRRLAYVLHNSLPYASGGYATRAQGLAQGLMHTGFEVICVTRPGFPVDAMPDLDRTAVLPEDTIDGIRYLRILEVGRRGAALDAARIAAQALEQRFREIRPEVVLAASAHRSALPALIAARELGLPFFYEVRGFWEITRVSREPEYEATDHFRVQSLLEVEVARQADHVFTLTGPMKAELIARGVPGERITLLPNSCDPERFTPRPRDAGLAARLGIPEGAPVIGYIGTFVQYEGLDDLARACALLKARGLVFRLMLVGNENTSGAERGPITAEIERVAAEEGLADWLILPGRVPHAEVEAYYSLIDVAPFPRKPQPVTEMVSPMKPLEALAMEKAVVVSSVRALAEMIRDGETGLVFAKGDVESLAATLARLIEDPALRARLGVAGRAWVTAERTWTRTAAIARAEIDRVVAAAAVAPALAPEPAPRPRPDPTPPALPRRGEANARVQTPALSPAGDREAIFREVRSLYEARDRVLGKVRFSKDDWERTRIAFDLLRGVPRVADIGIGQAQLVNLLARCPETERVVGYDFRDYSTRIDPPATPRYGFRVWDVTRPLEPPPEPADMVVAMEVLEHIAVAEVPAVYERLRAISPDRAILVTVPWREKHPLYHHDKPTGHKQSFDDARIEALFGPGCLYSDYRQKWYFVFAHAGLARPEAVDLSTFVARARGLIAVGARLETAGGR